MVSPSTCPVTHLDSDPRARQALVRPSQKPLHDDGAHAAAENVNPQLQPMLEGEARRERPALVIGLSTTYLSDVQTYPAGRRLTNMAACRYTSWPVSTVPQPMYRYKRSSCLPCFSFPAPVPIDPAIIFPADLSPLLAKEL
jgi:hypothetical protein